MTLFVGVLSFWPAGVQVWKASEWEAGQWSGAADGSVQPFSLKSHFISAARCELVVVPVCVTIISQVMFMMKQNWSTQKLLLSNESCVNLFILYWWKRVCPVVIWQLKMEDVPGRSITDSRSCYPWGTKTWGICSYLFFYLFLSKLRLCFYHCVKLNLTRYQNPKHNLGRGETDHWHEYRWTNKDVNSSSNEIK